ncbi:MAG: AsmA family protein [Rhodanobacteraceae bacterium]
MTALASWQRHRLRWILTTIGIVVLALLVALAVHVYALLQPERFTSLLEHDLAGAGIRLEMQAPAEPRLFPRPGVRLQAFSLTNIGARTPVLQAEGATIVVPWRAVLHGEPAIERVEVDAPRIDLGQLQALLARLPHRAGPPQLPTIATGVHMAQGTLSNNGTPLLFQVSLDTGELVPGHTFRMDVSARTAADRSVDATLSTVPADVKNGAIALDPIELRFAKQGGISMQLAGRGSWSGGENFALQLHGTLRHPSFAPPASAKPAPADTAATPHDNISVDNVVLDIRPAHGGTPLDIALQLEGSDAHVDFHLQPTEFGHWWQRVLAASPGHPAGPLPFTGTAAVKKLDIGPLKATGLRIEADPDLAPASTAAPASASSTAH